MATFKRPKSRVPNPQASTRSLATIKRKRKGKYDSSQVTLGFRLLSVVPLRSLQNKNQRVTRKQLQLSSENTRETMDLNKFLRVYRIFLDRHLEMPHGLRMLKPVIAEPLAAPPSPMSNKIASANSHTRQLTKLDAMMLLNDHLGYTTQDSLRAGDERGILRSHSQQWNANTVPVAACECDEPLAAAVKAVGSPRRPKPDVTYGYSVDLFSRPDMDHAIGLLPTTRAMQDGAAAMHSLWHLFSAGGAAQPQEHETAVFCACVGPTDMEIYISWRRDDPIEGVSWEMDRVCDAKLDREPEVAHIRSVLRNILAWAQSTRLDRIKAALTPQKHTPGVGKVKQDPERKKLNTGEGIEGAGEKEESSEESRKF
ncbi:hypothetical protein MMC15_003301 [Xylographa vitiligo]|nr:hypothetical protein [Xylographa vitiligo]